MLTVIKSQFRLLYKYYLILIPLMIYFAIRGVYESGKVMTMLAFYIGFMSGNGQSGYSDAFVLTNLPVSRKNILVGKYLFSTIASIIVFGLSFIGIDYFTGADLLSKITFSEMIYYLLILSFMSSFPIPFAMRFSQRKAMLLSMLISIGIMISVMILIPEREIWDQNYALWNKFLSIALFISIVIGGLWARNSLRNGVVVR
ncbi:MAG: ABC-2 transporter permease [Tissierellales bacterium]|nr:ABC-2 transporter permease [Tissierellales bacterium]